MSHESPAYRQLTERWARGEPTVLDGGIGSELQAMGYSPGEAHGPVNFTWGTLALYDTWQWEHTVSPDELADHARRYVAEGFATVGGCCGVQPAHIAAVARAVKPAPTPARGR